MNIEEVLDRAFALRACFETRDAERALTLVEQWRRDDPRGLIPLEARVEVYATLTEDWRATREALGYFLLASSCVGSAALDIATRFGEDPDARFRILQLWMSHDGRNRNSLRRMLEHLRKYDFFVAPAPTGMSEEAFLQAHGDLLRHYTQQYAKDSSSLSFWRDWIDPTDLQIFRGEVFTSQVASHDPSNYGPQKLVHAYSRELAYAREIDALGCLERFEDFGAYGGTRFRMPDGTIVSRDILDSTLELNFLARFIGADALMGATLVDIGAGWGRLVSRFLEMFHASRAYALDVVPFASFAAELYLRYRGQRELCRIGGVECLADLSAGGLVIASNVHSWSEAPCSSIQSWLDRLVQNRVKYLFFVSHDESAVSLEVNRAPMPILPSITARGYACIAAEPKYGGNQELSQEALYPQGYFRLFELGAAPETSSLERGAGPWSRVSLSPRIPGDELDHRFLETAPIGGFPRSRGATIFPFVDFPNGEKRLWPRLGV